MSGKENIKKWRKDKAKEGYKSRNYVLHKDIIDAIEAIAEKTNLDKSEVVSKSIEKLVESDYQKEIGIKKKGLEDFEETIEETSGDLKQFMRVYFEGKYVKEDIEKMKEFFKGKPLKNSMGFPNLKKNNPDIMKLKSHGEYKLFVKAFNLLNPS